MVLAKTNESIACSAYKNRYNILFCSDDLNYVNSAHFSLDPGLSRKLAPKWVGSFSIEQVISSVVYHISILEENGHIHPVFHISSSHGHSFLLHVYLLSFQSVIFLRLSMKLRTS